MIVDIILSVLSRNEPNFKPDPFDWKRDRKKTEDCIRKSGLFDAQWYLDQYPDVRHARIDPLHHFLHHGGTERRNPSAAFNSREYVRRYPDAATGHPLLHFLRYRDERQLTAPKVGEAYVKRTEPPAPRNMQVLSAGHAPDEISRIIGQPGHFSSPASHDKYDHDLPIGHGYGSPFQNGHSTPAYERNPTGENDPMHPRPGHHTDEGGGSAFPRQPGQTFSSLEMQQIRRVLAPLGLSVDETVTIRIDTLGTHGPITNTSLMLKRNSMSQAQVSNITHNAQIYSDKYDAMVLNLYSSR